jgi:acetyl-CoA C-acetyltransferase
MSSQSDQSLTPSPDDVVIVGAARTAQGRMLGALASKSAVELGAAALTGALEKAGVSPETVDYVYLGQVVQAAAGQNPAKQAAVAAGLPMSTPAVTVNKVCLSGLDAVINGARMIRAGDAAGRRRRRTGVDDQRSRTSPPVCAPGRSSGRWRLQDSLERDGLTDPVHGTAMGVETEEGNTTRGITREQQDEVAALSNQRAEAAIADGTFAEEIVPVEVTKRRETVVVDTDEGVRPGNDPVRVWRPCVRRSRRTGRSPRPRRRRSPTAPRRWC